MTQSAVAEDGEPRQLLNLWLSICAEAGPFGTLDDSYLDIGLIGLRQLPLGSEHAANEVAVCHGLALWAGRQRPSRQAFLARWREVESLYPRGTNHWQIIVAEVVHAVENAKGVFPAADWWRVEVGLLRDQIETDARRQHRRHASGAPRPRRLAPPHFGSGP